MLDKDKTEISWPIPKVATEKRLKILQKHSIPVADFL